jgi:hypothetical protein
MKARRLVAAIILAVSIALVGGIAAAGPVSVHPMCGPFEPLPCGE